MCALFQIFCFRIQLLTALLLVSTWRTSKRHYKMTNLSLPQHDICLCIWCHLKFLFQKWCFYGPFTPSALWIINNSRLCISNLQYGWQVNCLFAYDTVSQQICILLYLGSVASRVPLDLINGLSGIVSVQCSSNRYHKRPVHTPVYSWIFISRFHVPYSRFFIVSFAMCLIWTIEQTSNVS